MDRKTIQDQHVEHEEHEEHEEHADSSNLTTAPSEHHVIDAEANDELPSFVSLNSFLPSAHHVFDFRYVPYAVAIIGLLGTMSILTLAFLARAIIIVAPSLAFTLQPLAAFFDFFMHFLAAAMIGSVAFSIMSLGGRLLSYDSPHGLPANSDQSWLRRVGPRAVLISTIAALLSGFLARVRFAPFDIMALPQTLRWVLLSQPEWPLVLQWSLPLLGLGSMAVLYLSLRLAPWRNVIESRDSGGRARVGENPDPSERSDPPDVPDVIETSEPTLEPVSPPCPVCGFPCSQDTQHSCPRCATVHHADCWDYAGGCAVFGCDGSRWRTRLATTEPSELMAAGDSWGLTHRRQWTSLCLAVVGVNLLLSGLVLPTPLAAHSFRLQFMLIFESFGYLLQAIGTALTTASVILYAVRSAAGWHTSPRFRIASRHRSRRMIDSRAFGI